MAQQDGTISAILQQLAQQYNASVSERVLCERVLEQRPSQAKDPFASIREKLRWDGAHVGWVRIGAGEVIPLRIVREGLRFRIIPDEQEYRNEQIVRFRLLPFVNHYDAEIHLEDVNGSPIHAKQVAFSTTSFVASGSAIDLNGWFRRNSFKLGDSILITIRSHSPLVLRLEHEPQAAFRADDVLRQERELVDSAARSIGSSRSNLTSAEELILPIFARAEWRTGYPGRPWQALVDADSRLRLVDGLFIASSNFRSPLDFLAQPQFGEQEHTDLLQQITALQAQMRASRRNDAEAGIWDGMAPRASTARVVFDIQAGTSTVIFLEPIDTREDHSEQIEQNLEQGGYDDADWGDEFDDDDSYDDFEGFDDLEGLEFEGLSEIDDLQQFMDENPKLAGAAQKLMAALTPEEVDQLQNTESVEEAKQILASRLHQLLPSDPSLFATFAPYSPDVEDLQQNGLLNGNGHTGNHGSNGTNGGGYHGQHLGQGQFETDWDPDASSWDELSEAQISGDAAASMAALEKSSELMERFQQHLRTQGKSETTANNRAGDLWAYADFLGNYYNRSLAEGDYATLDECMFFFYPRKVLNSTARSAREMCTSIKQFYAYLRSTDHVDDQFAQAIWRRRDQVAQVIELYEQIDGDSVAFERLFAFLFAPYTA